MSLFMNMMKQRRKKSSIRKDVSKVYNRGYSRACSRDVRRKNMVAALNNNLLSSGKSGDISRVAADPAFP